MSLILLTGDKRQGKTTACRLLAQTVLQHGAAVGGIIAPAVIENDVRIGYDITDLSTDQTAPLARINAAGVEHTGPFNFLPEGLALGRTALASVMKNPPLLVIVDEVGPLEFDGGGWAEYLDELALRPALTLFVVRSSLADDADRRWAGGLAPRFNLEQGPEAFARRVIALMRC